MPPLRFAPPRTVPLALVHVLAFALGVTVATPAPAASAAAARSDLERRVEDVVVGLHDEARTDPGRFGYGSLPSAAPLTGWTDIRDVARVWADEMGRRGLSHNSGYPGQMCCARASGENVGSRGLSRLDPTSVTAAARALVQAWMDSGPHRANVMDTRFDEIGVGARIVADGSRWKLFVTVNLRDRDPSQSPEGLVYHRPARHIADTCQDAGSAGFRDVPREHTHRYTIDCIASHDVTSGRRDGTFAPHDRVRRGQLATFLVRTLTAAGVTLPGDPRDHFDDDRGHPHEHSLNVLAEAGLIDTSDRRTRPDHEVSRAEMAVWTYDALVHGGGVNPGRPVGDHFSDDDAERGRGAIDRLADRGVITGRGGGTFQPGQPLRRDQMATFLARGLDLLLDT